MTIKTIAFAVGISAFAGLAAVYIWVAVEAWLTDRRLARQDEDARRLVAEARTEEARIRADRRCSSGEMCAFCPLAPATCGHAPKRGAEGGAR